MYAVVNLTALPIGNPFSSGGYFMLVGEQSANQFIVAGCEVELRIVKLSPFLQGLVDTKCIFPIMVPYGSHGNDVRYAQCVGNGLGICGRHSSLRVGVGSGKAGIGIEVMAKGVSGSNCDIVFLV